MPTNLPRLKRKTRAALVGFLRTAGSDKKGTPNKPSVDISSAGPRRAAGIDVEIRSDVSSSNMGWWGGGIKTGLWGDKVARTTVQLHQTRVFCLLYTLLH